MVEPNRRASYDDFRRQSEEFHVRQRNDRSDEKVRFHRFQHESRKRTNDSDSQHDNVTPRAKKTRHTNTFEQEGEKNDGTTSRLETTYPYNGSESEGGEQRDPPSHSRPNGLEKKYRRRQTMAQIDLEDNIEVYVDPSTSYSTEDGSTRSVGSETKSKTSNLIAMWSKRSTQDSRHGRHMKTTQEFMENSASNDGEQEENYKTPSRLTKLYGKNCQFPDRNKPETGKSIGQTPDIKSGVQAAATGQTSDKTPGFQSAFTGSTPSSVRGLKSAFPGPSPNTKPGFQSAFNGIMPNTKPGFQPSSSQKVASMVKQEHFDGLSDEVKQQQATNSSARQSTGHRRYSIDLVPSGGGSRKSQVDPPTTTSRVRPNDSTPLKSGRGGRDDDKYVMAAPRSSSRGIVGGGRPAAENSTTRSESRSRSSGQSQQTSPSSSAPPPPPPPGAQVSRINSRDRSTGRASPLARTPSKDHGSRNQTRGRLTDRAAPPLASSPSQDLGSCNETRGTSAGRDSPPLTPPSKDHGSRNQPRRGSVGRAAPPLSLSPSKDQGSRNQARRRSIDQAAPPLTSSPFKDQSSRKQARGGSAGPAPSLTSTPSKDQGDQNQVRGRSTGRTAPPLTSPSSKDHSTRVCTRSRSTDPRLDRSSAPSQEFAGQKQPSDRSVCPSQQVPLAFSRDCEGRSIPGSRSTNLTQQVAPTYSNEHGTRSDARSRSSTRASQVVPTYSQGYGMRSESHSGSAGRTPLKTTETFKQAHFMNHPDIRTSQSGLRDKGHHKARQSFPVPSTIRLAHISQGSSHSRSILYEAPASTGKTAQSMGADESLFTRCVAETNQEYESISSTKEHFCGPMHRTPSRSRQSAENIEDLFPSSRRESHGLDGKRDRINMETDSHADEYHNVSRLQQLERSRDKSRKSTGSANGPYLSSGRSFRSMGRASPLLKLEETKNTSQHSSEQPQAVGRRARKSTGQIYFTRFGGISTKRNREPINPDESNCEREKEERKRKKVTIQIATVSNSSSMDSAVQLEINDSGSSDPISVGADASIISGEVERPFGIKDNCSAERQFSVDVLYPTCEQKKFGETANGYTIWCSYGHEKPSKYHAWNPPAKVFDASYATLEAANKRAEYFFRWENAFGVEPERLDVICNNFGEKEKQNYKSFECRAVGGGKTWRVAVVPTRTFEWLDRASIHRHSYGESQACDVQSTLVVGVLSVD